jgi:hypothetical protein
MKLGKLKSVGHNLADSFASGMGFFIGVYQTDIFAEAAGEPEGFVVVDFLAGTTTAKSVSAGLRGAITKYMEALPHLCLKHGIDWADLKRLEVRYGTDSVHGPHFTVAVESTDGKQSVDQYVGTPGRRIQKPR